MQLIMLVGCVLSLHEQPTQCPAHDEHYPVAGSSRRFAVYFPPQFEVLDPVIFGSLFLSEFRGSGYCVRLTWWDVALHTGSGLLLGILLFLLVYSGNQQEDIDLHIEPAFMALCSFAFAIAAGAVWDIFEFAMDSWSGMNSRRAVWSTSCGISLWMSSEQS